MTRVEENNLLILPKRFSGDKDDCRMKVEMSKMNFIHDISKSLAIIADSCVVDESKDYYMHDMNLINYILNRFVVTNAEGIRVDIEDIYRGWEVQNGI